MSRPALLQAVAVPLLVGFVWGCALPAAAPGPRGVALVASPSFGSGSRLALVVGNASYPEGRLENPVNDAKDVAAALREVGFEVLLETNVGLEAMDDAIREFGKQLTERGGVGLFYYAGHGMQVAGENYLIPIDAKIRAERDVKYRSFPLGMALGELQAAGNPMNIVVLDACRNNPFRSFFRSGSGGLAKTDAPTGTIIAYATAPGRVAADGSGRNGIYTKHLLGAVEEEGLTIEQALKRVRIGVMEETDGRQTPWESSSLTGDFFFRESEPEPVEVAETPPKTEGLFTLAGGPSSEEPIEVAALPPGPGDALYRTDDLESAAEAEKELRQAWAKRLEAHQADFARATRLDEGDAPAALKYEAWSRLIDAYSEDDPFSKKDDELRTRAAARVEHWKERREGETPAPAPSSTSFGLEDLQEQAKAQRAARARWEAWLEEMATAYQAAIDYQKEPHDPQLNRKAWERFLESFADDVAHSEDDDAMREEARKMVAHWREQRVARVRTEIVKPELPPIAPDGAADQARATLESYRLAYEKQNFPKLAAIWLMNPDQERSMEMLFECADRIDVETEELGIHVRGDRISIDFQQRLRFEGPRCTMKSQEQATQMTATLIRSGPDGWVISSIIPLGPR